MKKQKVLPFINISLKILLVTCFGIAIFGDLPQLAGKGMEVRAPFFIALTLVLPLCYRLKKTSNYPHMADILIALPPLLDTLGNLFGLFDTLWYFDDLLHVANWMFFIMVFHALRFRKFAYTREAFYIGVSVGALLIVLWELAEWAISVDGFGIYDGLHLSYKDTMGDLLGSTLGGMLGSFLGIKLQRQHKKPI